MQPEEGSHDEKNLQTEASKEVTRLKIPSSSIQGDLNMTTLPYRHLHHLTMELPTIGSEPALDEEEIQGDKNVSTVDTHRPDE
uniref:Uncharacterized protein n=1 Tax=Oryza sativa subsp. japonica TaxID=39947 RepID=Q6EPJ3_ORYSJ|nr:hypothetical protein [Oryza sativa Japonica Group]